MPELPWSKHIRLLKEHIRVGTPILKSDVSIVEVYTIAEQVVDLPVVTEVPVVTEEPVVTEVPVVTEEPVVPAEAL
jgi:hypothetical protein